METKKNKKVDLRSKRLLFFEIGMVVSIAGVLAAFQWTTSDKLIPENLSENLNLNLDEEWLPIHTERQKPQPQPKSQVVKTLDIVEDDENIDDIDIMDTEGDLDTPVTNIAMDDEKDDDTEPEIFYVVEEMPVYPGGNKVLMKDIMSRIVYPEIAKENCIQGRVYVQFIVNSKGKVDKVKVSRGVDPSLDNEAIRVIKTLTGWTPGKQRGKAVNVSYTIPINFQLN